MVSTFLSVILKIFTFCTNFQGSDLGGALWAWLWSEHCDCVLRTVECSALLIRDDVADLEKNLSMIHVKGAVSDCYNL